MNQRTLADVRKDSNVTPVTRPTQKQLLLTVARMFRTRGNEIFAAIPDVEFKSDNVIQAISCTGTALEPVVTVLNAANVPTAGNALAVRQSLGLKNPQLHELVCACKGAQVDGNTLANRFTDLANSIS